MKIKSLGRLFGGRCPAVLSDQPTRPGLTFNTSVAVLFSWNCGDYEIAEKSPLFAKSQ